jgi:protein-tyrosine phosphatase
MRSVLFVCTANICRSPMAEGVLRKQLAAAGMESSVRVDSVGTHDMRAGSPPSPLAVESAKRRGYDIEKRVARALRPADLDDFDLILCMDKANVAHLRTVAPTRCKQKIELLLEYGDRFHGKEVPDPYGGKAKDFELALDMIEDGCAGVTQLLARAPRPR